MCSIANCGLLNPKVVRSTSSGKKVVIDCSQQLEKLKIEISEQPDYRNRQSRNDELSDSYNEQSSFITN